MTKKLLISTLVLLFPALALADPGTAGWANVGYSTPAMDVGYDIPTYESEGHRVVDLTCTQNAGERVTTMQAEAYFQCAGMPPEEPCCGTFWEHPVGADIPPNPALFGAYGLLPYDSFYSCPEDWPSALGNNDTSMLVTDHQDCYRFAQWYVNPEQDPIVVGGGPYTMARYNFMIDCSVCPPGTCVPYDTGYPVNCWLVIEGDYFYASTGGDIAWHFRMDIPVCWDIIPEPASLGLLALGALALLRRR